MSNEQIYAICEIERETADENCFLCSFYVITQNYNFTKSEINAVWEEVKYLENI